MDAFFTRRRLFSLVIVGFLFILGCTRISTTELGGGLIPIVDGVNTFDTLFNVNTDTYEDKDSIRIYKSDNHVVGVINNDPLFGKSNASLFFELASNIYPLSMQGVRDSIKVDSAVLILSYRGYYGDSTKPLKLNVFEVNGLIEQFKVYPVNYPQVYPINYYSTPIAPTKTVDIRRLGDSVKNRYENAVNQIRIPLNQSFARRMITGYDTTNAYKSDSAFRAYFNGFAVIPDPSTPANAMLHVNLGDSNTKLALYYSTASTGSTARDTVVTYLKFNTLASGDVNYVTRNRTGSEVAKYISVLPKSDSLVYVQAMPGTGVRIRVPGLQSLSNRIIHRAELITEQIPDDANLITTDVQMNPPRYLLLSIYDSVNRRKRNIPNDYQVSLSGPNVGDFGGFLTYKSIMGYNRVAAYNFNISRYLQGVASRKDTAFNMILTAPVNDSLYYTSPYPNQLIQQQYFISPTYANEISNGRIRLGGGTHTRFRMRLRIVYSKI
jgi:hypothetical protein